MAVFDLGKLTEGLSKVWSGYLRDWDRSLRSVNHPETTRYNYVLAAAQLARYLADANAQRRGVARRRDRALETRPVHRRMAAHGR